MPDTVFAVQRLRWDPPDHYAGDRYRQLRHGRDRVAGFPDPTAAAGECARLEADARRGANPFDFGGPAFHYQTRFDGPRLRDWFLDAGVEPPAADAPFRAWRVWWAAEVLGVTAVPPDPSRYEYQWHFIPREGHRPPPDGVVARLWEAFDRVRFFEVAELPARPAAYVVLRVHWTYGDDWYYRDSDGGTPLTAYRSRERAEAEWRKLEAQARAEWGNPFRVVGSHDQTSSLGEGEFWDRVHAAVGTRPRTDGSDWEVWFAELTDESREAVWNLCDKVRFFEVAEADLSTEGRP